MSTEPVRDEGGHVPSSPRPRRIGVLDEHIANKIAAGEVIERPASVVKELVENALDAGARRIEVEVKAGGKQYIRVTDDGGGIAPDEVALAFERHATSKIAAADDLFDIGTLGFRGEALPSIAAVAEVEVRTRTRESMGGVSYRVQAGQRDTPQPIGMPVGTSVIVRRLFFNTPARYKFLRTDGAERRRVADVVARVALAWPTVSFRLIADDRELFSTPGDGHLPSAIGAIYGAVAVNSLVPVRFEQEGLRVDGYVSKPDALHGNRDRMSVFLNRRWIQSSSLLHAIQRGYETLLPSRRFPLAVLHLTVDARSVDVNVHPAKSEVRFQDDGAVYRAVMRAVRYGLLEANLVGSLDGADEAKRSGTVGPSAPEQVEGRGDGSRRPYVSPVKPSSPPVTRTYDVDTARPKHTALESATGARSRSTVGDGERPRTPHQHTLHAAMYEAAWREAAGSPRNEFAHGAENEDADARVQLREMTIIGQLHRTFILGEVDSGLWIVDQHVAHERVLYEQYLHDKTEAAGVQRLLVPVVVTLTPDRIGLVEQFSEQLHELGFELQPFGGASYAVRGVPVALGTGSDEGRLTALVEEVVDACVTDGRWNAHGAAAALSCKAAVKAGDVLTREQMQQLILKLADADNPFACPHGRPIVIEVSRFDLERRFGRR